MTLERHLDVARKAAIDSLNELITEETSIERVVLIDDLFGLLRAIIWTKENVPDSLRNIIDERLNLVASPFWSHEIFLASNGSDVDQFFYNSAWEEGSPIEGKEVLRISDRYRNRGSWLRPMIEPQWRQGKGTGFGPPIIVFYSFKGGVGRSTALAAFALNRARAGDRVAVVDFDLDAPGVGVLLDSDEKGFNAQWGVLDYLLERQFGDVNLRDYYHVCRREDVVKGSGEILIFPAGKANSGYIGKLARIDFEQPTGSKKVHPLQLLLEQMRGELEPDWILIDSRAGLSDPAGLLLGGLAHLYVVFSTSSEQSWQGLSLVLRRLGAEQVRADKAQTECIIVQSMVPENLKVARVVKAEFADRARDEFAYNYYAEDPEDSEEDSKWYVRDLDDEYAPHVPVSISYQQWLAHFDTIDEIADKLADSQEHGILSERIMMRFSEEEDEENG